MAREGDWLIAERQTAGRGRLGRAWASPSGNLYASGLVQLRDGDPPAPTLALVAGVALHTALGCAGSMLKWPNDVLTGGAKLAGILLERHEAHVVVGIGVNVAHHPDLPDRPTTSLAALGIATTPMALHDALAASLARWIQTWRVEALSKIRSAWLDRAHPIGTPLSAALPDGSRIAGRFAGLTDACALQLRLVDDQVCVIHAGDVFVI